MTELAPLAPPPPPMNATPDSLGDVTTPLGTFRCTLRAVKAINAIYGNYRDVFLRLEVFDVTAYFAVAAAGLGKPVAEVEQQVAAAGMDALVNPFGEFVGLCSRGGRPLPPPDAPQAAPGNV